MPRFIIYLFLLDIFQINTKQEIDRPYFKLVIMPEETKLQILTSFGQKSIEVIMTMNQEFTSTSTEVAKS